MGVRYDRAAQAVYREAHGNVYVLPPAGHDPVVLSGSGTAIWHAFFEPKTIDEVIDDLSGTHDAPAQVITRDVQSTVEDLAGRGLLVAK